MTTTVSEVLCGDSVKLLPAFGPNWFDLAIADPPYNFGQAYDAYADNLSYAKYMAWTRQWVEAVVRSLKPTGSLWIFVPDEWVSEVDVLCKQQFKLVKRRHVVWTFTFGVACAKNFAKSHCHLLYYTRHRTKYTFNADAARVPSARQLVFNDKRANPNGKLPDATWMLLLDQLAPVLGGLDKDVWLESRVCGTFKERKKHSPNQIPVPIMDRIVRTCASPGDRVLDPFCGTGSSGVAAAKYGCHYVGVDLSKTGVAETKKRIAEAVGS